MYWTVLPTELEIGFIRAGSLHVALYMYFVLFALSTNQYTSTDCSISLFAFVHKLRAFEQNVTLFFKSKI